MTRQQLEHIIRAAGAITGQDELVIVGSQAILGLHAKAPEELLVSREADVYPLQNLEQADLIDGSIGEGSPFDEQFGYYAHGVGPETAILPTGWRQRLVPIRNENTRGVTGWCLHPCDLAVSKLIAGRDRDLRFVRGLLRHRLLTSDEIETTAQGLAHEQRSLALSRLRSLRTHGE